MSRKRLKGLTMFSRTVIAVALSGMLISGVATSQTEDLGTRLKNEGTK